MWTIFSGSWTTFIAYFAAVIFYQSATIYEHPISSLLWVATMLALLAIAILAMKTAGDSNRRKVLLYANGKA
jgi:ferrous iron transport protein B